MNRTVLTGFFIFSLALNLAVAGTLGWHWWQETHPTQLAASAQGMPFSPQEWMQLRHKVWQKEQRGAWHELRQEMFAKRSEVLDLIAANPGNPAAGEKSLDELIALRGRMEKKAMTDLAHLLANLPEEKRAQFLAFLKSRACGGPGMGMRHGGRRMMRCPAGRPSLQGPSPEDSKNFSRDSAPPPVSE
jgi:hypothetical protein